MPLPRISSVCWYRMTARLGRRRYRQVPVWSSGLFRQLLLWCQFTGWRGYRCRCFRNPLMALIQNSDSFRVDVYWNALLSEQLFWTTVMIDT